MKKATNSVTKTVPEVAGNLAVKACPDQATVEALLRSGLKMGNVTFCAIPVDMLEIEPSYQRIQCDFIQAIADHWDYSVCGSIKVNYRNGRLYVKDGQNRVGAAKRAQISVIMCAVTEGETVDREIDAFVYQNQFVTKISPYDIFYARWHKTTDTVAHELKALFDQYKIVYESVNAGKKYGNRYISRAPSPRVAGRLNCMTMMMGEADCGHLDLLKEVFETVKVLGWHTMKKTYSKEFMQAMLNAHRGRDAESVRRIFLTVFKKQTPESVINRARVEFDKLSTGAALNAFINQYLGD